MPIQRIEPINERVPEVRRIPPSVISTIEVPIIHRLPPPVTQGITPPKVKTPGFEFIYPTIDVPTQAEYDEMVKEKEERQQAIKEQKKVEEKEEKTREMGDSPSQLTEPTTSPTTTEVESSPTINVVGYEVPLPEPALVATAATLAVVSTMATMGATMGFNAAKKVLGPAVQNAAKKNFKVKIKQTKPVLHYVTAKDGHIDIFEYSDQGTRLVDQVKNAEQYIRDKIEVDPLYEIDNKVIIDDSMINTFSREGKERFKVLFAPPKKIAKRLGAKISFF